VSVASVNITNFLVNNSQAFAGGVLSLDSTGSLSWGQCIPQSITSFLSSSSLLNVTSDPTNTNLALSLAGVLPTNDGGIGSSTPLNPYSLQYALNSSFQSSLSTGNVDTVLGTKQTNQPPSWIASVNWTNLTFAEPLSPSSGGTGNSSPLVPNSVVSASSNSTQGFVSPGLYGQVLESTGPDSPPSWTWPSPGTLKFLVQNFTRNGTFTFPPNVVYTYIIAIGGGAGGLNSITSWGDSGAGGGGGGLSYVEIPGPTVGTVNVSVGAGGQFLQDGGTTQIGQFLVANGGSITTAGGSGYNTEFGISSNGGDGGAGTNWLQTGSRRGNAGQDIDYLAPTGGGSGDSGTTTPNEGAPGGNVTIGTQTILMGGFGSVDQGNGGSGLSSSPPGFAYFAGSGGGGASYFSNGQSPYGSIPGTGGLYGGGAGGATYYNGLGPGAAGASGFVWIMVHYLG